MGSRFAKSRKRVEEGWANRNNLIALNDAFYLDVLMSRNIFVFLNLFSEVKDETVVNCDDISIGESSVIVRKTHSIRNISPLNVHSLSRPIV